MIKPDIDAIRVLVKECDYHEVWEAMPEVLDYIVQLEAQRDALLAANERFAREGECG